MLYKDYLDTNHWRILRAYRLWFDNYKCQECGYNYNLQVHHKTYKRIGKENISDVITLCEGCHESTHKIKCELFNNIVSFLAKEKRFKEKK